MLYIKKSVSAPSAVFTALSMILFLLSCGSQEPDGPITPKAEYTQEDPAEWTPIAPDHKISVKILENSSRDNVIISLPEYAFNNRHYIERIGVMDENRRDIVSQEVGSGKRPVVSFTMNPLPPRRTRIKVYAKDNLHDLWTTYFYEDEAAYYRDADQQK